MHSLLGGRPRNDVFLWVAEYICLILVDIARRFSWGVVKNYDIFCRLLLGGEIICVLLGGL